MPPLSFSSLPTELQLLVCQKTSLQTLCRLRKTCTAIDNLIKENKVRIAPRCKEGRILVLSICVCEVAHFAIGDGDYDHLSNISTVMNDLPGFKVITKPLEQLECIRFDVVGITFERRMRWSGTPQHNWYKWEWKVFQETVLPVVRKTRIQTDWLIGDHIVPVAWYSKDIRFMRLCLPAIEMGTREFMELEVAHCTNLILHSFVDILTPLSHLLGNAAQAKISFKQLWHDSILTDFLKQSRASKAKVRLKSLKLRLPIGTTYICDDPEVIAFWKRRRRFVTLNWPYNPVSYCGVYKISILGGMVMMFQDRDLISLEVLEEDSREALLSYLTTNIFRKSNIPGDTVELFQEFRDAESEQQAFDVFHNKFTIPYT